MARTPRQSRQGQAGGKAGSEDAEPGDTAEQKRGDGYEAGCHRGSAPQRRLTTLERRETFGAGGCQWCKSTELQ